MDVSIFFRHRRLASIPCSRENRNLKALSYKWEVTWLQSKKLFSNQHGIGALPPFYSFLPAKFISFISLNLVTKYLWRLQRTTGKIASSNADELRWAKLSKTLPAWLRKASLAPVGSPTTPRCRNSNPFDYREQQQTPSPSSIRKP